MTNDQLIGYGLLGVVAYLLYSNTNADGTSAVDNPDGSGGFGFDPYADTVGAFQAMTSSQTVSSNGVALISQHEGCQLKAYPDAGGYSIGYGHHNATAGQTCTQAQADAWLQDDAVAAANAVLKYTEVQLGQNQLDALTDFVYNVGAGAFASSTLRSVINAGNLDQVPAQLQRWIYSQGKVNQALVQRRQDEIDLWNTPDGGMLL